MSIPSFFFHSTNIMNLKLHWNAMEDMLNTFLIKHKHPVRDVGADFSLLFTTLKEASLSSPKTAFYFFLIQLKQLF